MKIRNSLGHFYVSMSWDDIGIFMRICGDLKTTLKRSLWSWGRTLCWIQLNCSLCSDVQMRWFQLENLDHEVYYTPSKYESNQSYESKVTEFLPKSHSWKTKTASATTSGWNSVHNSAELWPELWSLCLGRLASSLALVDWGWVHSLVIDCHFPTHVSPKTHRSLSKYIK